MSETPDEETFHDFAQRQFNSIARSGRIIRLDRREWTLDMFMDFRDDIMQDCPCCDGVGAHYRTGTVQVGPFQLNGIEILECRACDSRGKMPYMSTN